MFGRDIYQRLHTWHIDKSMQSSLGCDMHLIAIHGTQAGTPGQPLLPFDHGRAQNNHLCPLEAHVAASCDAAAGRHRSNEA